jgi:hypothetical protein
MSRGEPRSNMHRGFLPSLQLVNLNFQQLYLCCHFLFIAVASDVAVALPDAVPDKLIRPCGWGESSRDARRELKAAVHFSVVGRAAARIHDAARSGSERVLDAPHRVFGSRSRALAQLHLLKGRSSSSALPGLIFK